MERTGGVTELDTYDDYRTVECLQEVIGDGDRLFSRPTGIAAADWVAGPVGSGLYNYAFSPPTCRRLIRRRPSLPPTTCC
jgi:hypothetical protein